MNPKRRMNDVLVEVAGDEVVVYDQQRQVAHRLNRTAGIVFQHADGHTTVDQLTSTLQHEFEIADARQLVEMALDELSEAQLMERQMPKIGKGAIAVGAGLALLLPVVETLIAPPAEAAASQVF